MLIRLYSENIVTSVPLSDLERKLEIGPREEELSIVLIIQNIYLCNNLYFNCVYYYY